MKILKILLVFFIISSCNKKTEFVKAKIKLSKIDSLKTKKEIEQLIGNIDSLYKKIEIKRIQDFNFEYSNDSIFKELAKRKKVDFDYVKTDFDNNGLTDILLIGNNKTYTGENYNPKLEVEFSKEFNSLVLMNFGKNKYKLFDISEEKFYPIVPKAVIEKSEVFLIINKPKLVNDARKTTKREESSSKLTFKFDDFIEYNSKPINYEIEKIEFNSIGCPGNCPIFKIEISNNRKSKIIAEAFNYSKEWQKGEYIEGNYSAIIKENDLDNLKDLLCYTDFPNLKMIIV